MSVKASFRVHRIFLACTGVIASLANAGSWAPPYTGSDTVGGILEDRFSELLKQCNIRVPLRKTVQHWYGESFSEPLSAIPASLQGGALPLSSQLLQVKELSAARLFAYLYRDAEQIASFAEDNSRNLAEAEFANEAAEFLIKGGFDVAYKQTCGSVVSAAANSSSEWSMPGASMSAALQSDFNSKNQNVFVLTSGLLHSPLASLIESDDPYKKLRGNLVIWQWYALGGDGKVSYLRDLQGVVLYEYSATNNKINGAVKLKGGGGVPGIAASGSIDDSLSSEWSYQIAQSRTILLKPEQKNTAWGTFKPAPSVDDIVTASRQARGKARNVKNIISPGVENVHTQFFPGLESKCNANIWFAKYQLTSDITNGSLDIKNANIVKADGGQPGGCEFQISFVPRSGITLASLNFNLQYLTPASGKNIELPAGQVDLVASRAPHISRLTDDQWWRQLPSVVNPDDSRDATIEWTIKYNVEDDAADKTSGKTPTIDSITLACPGDLRPFLIKDVQYKVGMQQMTLTLKTKIASTSNRDVEGKYTPVQCSLVGTADFEMQSQPGSPRVQKQPIGKGVVLFYPAYISKQSGLASPSMQPTIIAPAPPN